jgi:hypothetical protein
MHDEVRGCTKLRNATNETKRNETKYYATKYTKMRRETDTVLKKTVDTHKILINAIKFYVCPQEI